MDFMKVLDQTVREIKREVNMKVLKVPEIEQKVLDATNNEPWGPHGSALSEIAQATKKFTECQMVMNVLWTRLNDTGRNWRHVYKALAVIEYLVANGSQRAIDDIIEHTFQISAIAGFEYVEPNGKDMGILVRKKVETILGLLNNKDKIEEVRNKASANRDKYFGLSSTGITYKSSSASYGSGIFRHNDRYDGESLKDGYKDRDRHRDESDYGEKDGFGGRDKSQSHGGLANEGDDSKKGPALYGKNSSPSTTSRASTKLSDSDDKYGPIPSQSSSAPVHDDFDDFDPRGSSTTGSKQMDLFGESLIADLMDAPTLVPTEKTATNNNASAEVDLFADATFVSASPHVEAEGSSQANVDLFVHQPASTAAFSSTVDFFDAPNPALLTETKSSKSESTNPNTIDPFAAMPLNNFEGSDLFGAFTSHTDPLSTDPTQPSADKGLRNQNQNTVTESKKDTFQVKSGIWADTLSRGLIDLNISAPKKASLAGIGIVGGLTDGSEEEKRHPTPAYMGKAMGLGKSGFTSTPPSTGMGGNGSFSKLSEYQFGSFK
ncbi:clathrin interactor EPSIN 1-like isoform X2 [Tasmannia lanceolata]|uniref:clathrin interactor EPSIN 1-like isoform X2 n=1 Tax=Tasmannia lanceolata TaxID=3420 RepID=UPI004063B590